MPSKNITILLCFWVSFCGPDVEIVGGRKQSNIQNCLLTIIRSICLLESALAVLIRASSALIIINLLPLYLFSSVPLCDVYIMDNFATKPLHSANFPNMDSMDGMDMDGIHHPLSIV